MPTLTQLIAVGTAAAVTISSEAFESSVPLTVAAVPGSGGTLAVAYQLAASGTWHNWPAGAAASTEVYLLTGPVYALKFTAATQPGVIELTQ